MDVHVAALKHGVSAEDGTYAAQHAVYVAYLDDDSHARQLRLGFDTSGRLLEVVVLLFDSGDELLIHAMKARVEYLDLLQ